MNRIVRPGYSHGLVSMFSDLTLLLDPLSLLAAAWLSTLLSRHWLLPAQMSAHGGSDLVQAALIAAVLAPFVLYDRHFGAQASRGRMAVLAHSHALRFSMFAAVMFGLGVASRTLNDFPRGWLVSWFVASLVLTSLSRVLMANTVRRLQRQGMLSEVVAVVGAGPVADRLVQLLRQTLPQSIELLGIFDDRAERLPSKATRPVGTLQQLIELGKTRKIDWIVLTLPPTAQRRLTVTLQRLKALSVPIGLCPQHVGLSESYQHIDYVGDSVPVSLLADRPVRAWELAVKHAADVVPRWIITLALLPLAAFEALARRPEASPLTYTFDAFDTAAFSQVAASFGEQRYGYAVTPNADHLIRLHDDTAFRALYAAADHVLLDSRFVSHLLRATRGIRLSVCPGSDLTEALFADVIAPTDRLVLIGGSDSQAKCLVARYGLSGLAHYNPPMGFVHDPGAVEACLGFIEAHSPFRFCLLAVGSPQQELLASHLRSRGLARGLALCIGASINFLTGDERRAPLWMQRCGIEWSYRLLQAPGRMARRYLVRGPRIFALLLRTPIVLRQRPAAPMLQLVRAAHEG